MQEDMTAPASAAYRYSFGNVEFDVASNVLLVSGDERTLEHKPLAVLHELLRHAGEVVTKQELLDSVWEGRPTVENVLANAVAKLRKALGPRDAAALITVPRVGYRLEAVVQRDIVAGPQYSALRLRCGTLVPGRDDMRLRRILGRSAGNEVWLAEHTESGVTAVFKFSLGGDELLRLKREVTLYRLLEAGLSATAREGIIEIRSWNFKTPPFYLECAYGGQTLADWAADEAHLQAMDEAGRIGLFLQIARSVAAAHSLGVLHKDIKPTNVLIEQVADGRWRLRLADFGASRLLDPSRLEALKITRLGLSESQFSGESLSGTPLYLAPELIGGESTTVQSDVYALGILLYQLLAGDLKLPIATGWQAIIGCELLREDISAATAGDPQERLQSVDVLIDRLQGLQERRERFRTDREERQRLRASEAALARMRARRPWIAAALTSIVIGFVGMSMLYTRAETALARAERVNAFWNEELVRAGNPHTSGELSIAELLDQASARLPARFPDDPATRATIHESLAHANLGLTRQTAGVRDFERALAAYAEAGLASSEAALRIHFQIARAQFIASQIEAGAQTLAAALAAAEPLSARSAAVRLAAARTQAVHAVRHDRWKTAVAHLEEAMQLQAALPQVRPREWFKLRVELVDGYRHLADHAAALALLEDMLDPAVDREAVGLGRVATARLQYGQILLDRHQLSAAEAAIRQALAEIEANFGDNHFNLFVAQHDFAVVNFKQGNFPVAVDYAQRAWEGLSRKLGEEHIVSFKAQAMVGITQLYDGKIDDALTTLNTVVDGIRRSAGAESVALQGPMFYLALALARAERYSEALPHVLPLNEDGLLANYPAENWALLLPALRGLLRWHVGEREAAEADLQLAVDQLGMASGRYPLLAAMLGTVNSPVQ